MARSFAFAPTLDPATRTLDAEVQLDNAAGALRPGMFGRGAIVVDVHPNASIVPATAVQVTNGKRYVFLLKGDKVERHEVETAWMKHMARSDQRRGAR